MKRRIKLIIWLFFVTASSLFAQHADDIVGKYHLPNNLDIEILKSNNKYFGKIIALNGFEDGQTKDINNPDKSKRNVRLIGKVIITNLKYDPEEKEWINGSMYGAEKGMFFDLKIKEVKRNSIEIEASKLFFWKTMEWTKL